MEKYLFADGTGGVREVHSRQELDTLIQAVQSPDKIRIWIFNTPEWISYAEFLKSEGQAAIKEKVPAPVLTTEKPVRSLGGRNWLKKFLFFSVSGAAIFLVYNFTRVTWKNAGPVVIVAGQPENVPLMDADSLLQAIEITRAQKLDRTTRTNLRIRNTWPGRILLQVNAGRDTSHLGTRYHSLSMTIDNTTGYTIDEAVVKLSAWRNGTMHRTDTFLFSNIGYAATAKRAINKTIRSDSLSVSFESIKARSFNFCYSSDKKSNYGSMTDRWFCRE